MQLEAAALVVRERPARALMEPRADVRLKPGRRERSGRLTRPAEVNARRERATAERFGLSDEVEVGPRVEQVGQRREAQRDRVFAESHAVLHRGGAREQSRAALR